ncbi:MAG: maleylpyruvate isomerase family mycothiol-dependent enzyme [Chloroflexi bacterium]|nr:maleylpyruvate isomerase family mycothiol-dependent enzyme [Chloroflexota bacterium]
MNIEPRAAETAAFLEAVQTLPPQAMTACPGWSAHHIAAHLAGSIDEAARHVEAFAAGQPLDRTRSFEEREAPYHAMPQSALLRAIDRLDERLRHMLPGATQDKPDATLQWTGRSVRVDGLQVHMRDECALHRWDLMGDDEVSRRLLSQPELLSDSVEFVGKPLLLRGLKAGAAAGGPFVARIRSGGQPDVVVDITGDEPTISLAAAEGEATIECDAAARLLVLWGRIPHPPSRVRACMGPASVAALQELLAGY